MPYCIKTDPFRQLSYPGSRESVNLLRKRLSQTAKQLRWLLCFHEDPTLNASRIGGASYGVSA